MVIIWWLEYLYVKTGSDKTIEKIVQLTAILVGYCQLLNRVKQLILAMVKCGVLFEVRTEFLNNIYGYTSFVFKGLNSVNQLIFVMAKCGVLFEVRTEFLNNI
jgi:hypothetical protein